MLPKAGCAPRRRLGDAVYLNWAADRLVELAAGAFERHDDLVQPQLRVLNYFLGSTHGAERDVHPAEDLVPMGHRLRAEDFVENGRKLGLFAASFAGSENRGSVRRSVRPIAFATAAICQA